MIQLQGAGITSGVVQNCEDLFKDPQVAHRHYFKALDHREMESTPIYRRVICCPILLLKSGVPLLFSGTYRVCPEKAARGVRRRIRASVAGRCPDVRGKRRGWISQMVGIETFGQYVPWWRLDLSALALAGEKGPSRISTRIV